MKRLGLLAVLITSACTGATYYPSSYGAPQYASSTTTTQSQSPDGTYSSTTESTTFEATPAQPASQVVAQPAAYEEEVPPPPPSGPPPSGKDPRCHKKDTLEGCIAVSVLLDIGGIVHENESNCRGAAKALNRYADGHAREIEVFLNLEGTLSGMQMNQWKNRLGYEGMAVINSAMALDQHCDGDQKLDRALRRVGFSGMIGDPNM